MPNLSAGDAGPSWKTGYRLLSFFFYFPAVCLLRVRTASPV
jgi:hypothetical protein